MPSSLQSRDSPRTRHGRRRSPRGQLARSGSLLGTLKNIVTAPLTWFSSQPEFTDVAGKRRRNPGASERDEDAYVEDDRPSAKRKRVDSPETISVPLRQPTRTTQGYLDVPEGLIPKKPASRQRLTAPASHVRSSSFAPSFSVPVMHDADLTRRTASPTISASYSQPVAIQRTQSMDPPAYRAISLSRDASMEGGLSGSASRDVTMSPTRRHTPFQLRARHSLTPQPSGQTFGPTPQHKGRDASEPPPLASLMSHPVFVKPPPEPHHVQPEQPITTLGSLAEFKGHTSPNIPVRNMWNTLEEAFSEPSRSPLRQHSSLYFGARSGTMTESSSTPYLGRVNAAEKALHDLDVYKTPLLPSRLRGSQTIPDMFKPKKTHAPVLMRSERERKPRLGTSEKVDAEEQPTASKPYAGRGGMKKMLAKRKKEEEEERERERASAIETDLDEEADGPHKPAYKGDESVDVQKKAAEIAPPPPEPVFPVRPVGGREQSSLRVGRTHTSRNHIARPVAKSRNRFSAAFDEDDGDDSMLDETREQAAAEEPKKLPTLFESPKGFSFAPEKAPIVHDSGKAKEPPIAALPFSLIAQTAPATQLAQPFSLALPSKAPSSPPKSESTTTAASVATPAPLFPPVPSISLIPPSPVPPKPETSTSTTSAPAIPNFFATSSIFSKPGVSITTPAPVENPVADNASKGESAPAASSTPFSFGNPGGSFSFGASTQPSAAPKEIEASKEDAPKPAASSLFGAGSTPSPFSFGGSVTPSAPSTTNPNLLFGSAPAAPKEISAPQPVSSLFSKSPAAAEAPKPAPPAPVAAPAPASSPFSFGAPAKPAEAPAPSTSPFSFGAPSATTPTAAPPAPPALFSFGAAKTDSAKESELKPLFGASEPVKPLLFGAPAPTPSPFGGSQPASATSESAPKSPFTFGQPAQTTTAAPVIEAPKPLFASTSTGGSGGFSFGAPAPATTPATPAKSPFSFGASPATPPVNTTENKPSFSFGAPSSAHPVSAPSALFGGPSSGADASKSFSFGAPTRPATPPRHEQEMRMEESPTRGGGMDMHGHEQPKPASAFSFGAPSGSSGVSPFGQPTQPTQSATTSFSFGAKPEVKTEPKPAAPFSFASSTSSGGGFGFGQKAAESAQSPISPAPFGSSTPFGQASNTPTTSAPAFSFGAPSAPSAGFGQGVSSTPASPSTFGQPAPFGFGTPTSATAPSNPFAFGSQPASPATGNTGLPQPPGSSSGTGFAFGQPSPVTTPATPFGAPAPAPGGGVAFTIGSAAPQQAFGPRTIKKLPTRRGGRLR
ncbi:hypothetical protein C2E23DRAFT_856465 [Lenzites betulinus]|nr:hypothetical protein C2E23DRAFT_856465 [Lenzites betulinus]